MKKFWLLLLSFVFIFGYSLGVKDIKSKNLLEEKGFNCKKSEGFYICATSKDINYLLRIKNFLKNSYKIDTLIINNNLSFKKKINTNVKKNNFSTNKLSPSSGYSSIQKTSAYCIQVLSSQNLNASKKNFNLFKNLPFTRIEKIGNFYVLRIGESSFQSVKALLPSVKNYYKKAFVRKCDLIPSRIIISNFKNNQINNKKSNLHSLVSNTNLITNDVNVKEMYYFLNIGDLSKARQIALKLKTTHPKDSIFVLGLVNMKNQNWQKACNYFSKLQGQKSYNLKKNSCYIYNLQKGYEYLNEKPKQALFLFKKAYSYKITDDVKLALGYAYLKLGYINRAYKIFKEMYKKHPNDKKIINAYAEVLYNMKKYKELKNLQNKLPQNMQNKISFIQFYLSLKEAQNLMKEKKYKQAEEILSKLYLENPNNINVMLTLGNLYLNTNKNEEAKNFYKNVLILSPNNIYALEGIEAVYMREKNYKKALFYSEKIEKLGFKDKNKKELQAFYYLSLANKFYKNKEFDKAYTYVKKAQIIEPGNPFVLGMLGDIEVKKGNNDKAYKYYAKAYAIGHKNFNVTLKFLYALLNLNLYDQIKLVIKQIDINKLNYKQKNKLKIFYINLYSKYAAYLLNEGKYKKSEEIVNEGILMDKDNPDLLSTKAWVCYKTKRYKCAKDNFKKAIEKKPSDSLKYGLALTYIKLGENKKAGYMLDNISNTENEKLKIKIADAYLIIGNDEKAQKLLNEVKPHLKNLEKEKIIIEKNVPINQNNEFYNPFISERIDNGGYVKKKIILKTDNKIIKKFNNIQYKLNLIKQNYTSNIVFGLKSRFKSGNNGLSKLDKVSFPYLKINYFYKKIKIYGILDNIYLNSGDLQNYNEIGSPNLKQPITSAKTKSNGLEPLIGVLFNLKKGFIQFEVGETPLNTSLVSPTLKGKLSIGLHKKSNKYVVDIYREPKKDSLTSYVGSIDPYTGKKWGRVIRTGIKAQLTHKIDNNNSMIFYSLTYETLKGKNVSNNYMLNAQLLPLFYYGNNLSNRDYIGAYINISHYKKDENNFYYGKGGYFSPNLFLFAAPRYEGYFYGLKNKFIAKIMAMAGVNYIDSNPGSFGFAFDIGSSAKYLLNNRFGLEGGFDLRNAKDYTDFFFTLQLRYYFGKKINYQNKDIDSLSKRIIKWQ